MAVPTLTACSSRSTARIPPWDRRIDAVILSHPHEDHVAGLALLLERYRVARVFEPGMRGPGPGYAAWPRGSAARARPIAPRSRRRRPARGRRDRVRGPVADPGPGARRAAGYRDRASTTCPSCSSARSAIGAFLLVGDVEQDIDPSLLADGLPRVDLLKVAHHGSRTATTAGVRGRDGPKWPSRPPVRTTPTAIRPATLDRLTAAGARVLRTDRDGTVVVGFGREGPTVRTEGATAAAVLAATPRAWAPCTSPTREARPPRKCISASTPTSRCPRSTNYPVARAASSPCIVIYLAIRASAPRGRRSSRGHRERNHLAAAVRAAHRSSAWWR